MKMKSERPLLVDGVPQTEFETNDQHGKELIAKGLAVEVGADLDAGLAADVMRDGSMTVAELKEALKTKGVEFEAGAKKADLQALLDAAP